MKKTPVKLKEYYVHVGVYIADVTLLVGPQELLIPWAKDPKNCQDRFRDELLASFVNAKKNPSVFGRTFFVGTGGGSIIWLPFPTDPNVYTHEISHAAYHILKAKGVILCDETDEVYAYLVEYLWKKLNPFEFRARRLKTKK